MIIKTYIPVIQLLIKNKQINKTCIPVMSDNRSNSSMKMTRGQAKSAPKIQWSIMDKLKPLEKNLKQRSCQFFLNPSNEI